MQRSDRRVRYACYMSNVSMAVAANLSPLLFMTFHDLYGISYTLLGAMVLVNFCTQLTVDLIFSFWSHKFPLQTVVRLMPLLTVLGLAVFALFPMWMPERAYLFLLIGTVIFSASAGLGEVLISPVIAALPSDHPERDMSLAHSVYAWGVAVIVPISTLWLYFFGRESWHWLALFWTVIPIIAFVLFVTSKLPPMQTEQSTGKQGTRTRGSVLLLCVLCIFLGGASENTMSQWCSGYLETAMGLPKLWGDVFGVTVFAVMLGLGRTLYAKYGKRISGFLLAGFCGAVACYLTAALSQSSILGLIACALTGFCVSMLWPGTLILTAELLPQTGVAVYAMLAAGGDLGGSVAPQLVGSITDAITASGWVRAGLTPEQLGLKVGMLSAAVFPLIGILVVTILRHIERRAKSK